MKYNRELQNIDKPNKSYLLGLFYADGNISKNQHHSKIYLKDKELIIRIKEVYDFFNYYETEALYGLHSGINKVRKDFIDNGCLPDKSFSNKESMRLPFKNNLTFDFIRGYFDGDGGCTLTYTNGKTQKRVYLYSASLLFLEDIKHYLFEWGITTTIIGSSKGLYKLTILVGSYETFYAGLYADNPELYMIRKKKKFDSILKTDFFIQKEAPNCKFCDSESTVYNGTQTYKQVKRSRVLCKECRRNFITRLPL